MFLPDQRKKTGRSPAFWEKYGWHLNLLLISVLGSLPGLWLGWYYGDWRESNVVVSVALAILVGITLYVVIIGLHVLSHQKKYFDPEDPSRAAQALLAGLRAPDDAMLPLLQVQSEGPLADLSVSQETIRCALPSNSSLIPLPRYSGIFVAFKSVLLTFLLVVIQSPLLLDIFNGNTMTLSDQHKYVEIFFQSSMGRCIHAICLWSSNLESGKNTEPTPLRACHARRVAMVALSALGRIPLDQRSIYRVLY